MAMLRLRESLSKVGVLFILCCSLASSDSDADTGTTADNQDSMITLATTVPNSVSDNSPSPREYTEYNEDDDMYLFGDYLNSVDEKQSVSNQDQAVSSVDDVKTESTGNVETSSNYPDSYIEDSEEADDLAMYGQQDAVEIKDSASPNGKEVSSGSDNSEANEDVSPTIENSNNVGGSDSGSSSGGSDSGSSSGESDSSESSSGESDDSHSKSDSSDESESSSDSDVDSVSGDEDETDDSNDVIDIESENGVRLTVSSADGSDSEEDSSGGDSKSKKNCKCKKEGSDEGDSRSKEGSDGTDSKEASSGTSDENSSGSSDENSSGSSDENSSGSSDENSSHGGNIIDDGDSSTEGGYSSSSEEFGSSESNEGYDLEKPDSPKQTVGNGLDKEGSDYSTSIHHFFTQKTNTVVKVVNTYSSKTPFSPSGSDLSRNSDPPTLPLSNTSPKPTSPKSYFIIQLTTTPPPVGTDPPIDIQNKGIPKWYEDLLRKREYVEQPVIRDYILTPKTSFWQPPDVAKPPDWQDQKEWINIKINLEKPAHWIDDPNSNGSIPRWNIPYIPPDWFKRKNEKTTTHLNFELTTPDPKMVHWSSPRPEERDRTTHIPEYLARKRVCDRTFDIVLAIDGTGNEKDFGYLKGALVQLLDRLIMGKSKVQVGVVLLGNSDGIQIPISGNRSELEDQIAKLGLPEDSNRYDIALKSAGELIAREGREGIPKVVIMIVNDNSRYEYHTRTEAARLHRSGISVFTVGVGYNTNEEELKTISSSQNEVIRVKNYVHLVYLMTGYVQLFCNVEDNYLNPPTLAPPQQTVKPKARMIAKLTTDVMSEPSPERAKALCEGCKMINGAGFNSHPSECDLFVHCYFGEMGLRAIIRRCPFAQFWNQTILSCQYSERAYCPMDRCSNMREREYEDPENCRAFWECSNGFSKGRCCRYGYHYVKGEGCTRDIDKTCRKSCPMDSPVDVTSNVNTPTKKCDKIPIANDKKNYQQLSPGTGYITMPCPEGTRYNERICTCTVEEPNYPTFSRPLVQEPSVGCRPEVKLDFSRGITDDSGKWTYINNRGVEIVNGMAYFNGNSRLLIPRFTNVDFGKTFVIRLRYKEEEKLKFNESQALVNNGDCGDFGSVQIFTKRNSIGYVVKTTDEPNHVSLQLHKPRSEWKDIEYIVSDQRFEGILNGVQATKWSKGSIEARQCALQIGFGHGYNNFKGFLSMLEIYLCKPEKPMKYS